MIAFSSSTGQSKTNAPLPSKINRRFYSSTREMLPDTINQGPGPHGNVMHPAAQSAHQCGGKRSEAAQPTESMCLVNIIAT